MGVEGRVRVHRVRLQGAAIPNGTSKAMKTSIFDVLDAMSYMKDPTQYQDGRGGKCSQLVGKLRQWWKFKPCANDRYIETKDFRIVFRVEVDSRDNVKYITVLSAGPRDRVYD